MPIAEPHLLQYSGESKRRQFRRRLINPVRNFAIGSVVAILVIEHADLWHGPLPTHIRFKYVVQIWILFGMYVLAPVVIGIVLITGANLFVQFRAAGKLPFLGPRLAPILASACFYPAAHLLYCKTMASIVSKDTYALRASCFTMVVPMLLIGIAATFAVSRRPPLGQRKMDWFLAGLGWPLGFIANAQGANYLDWSWNGWDGYSTPESVVVIAIFGGFVVPLIVALSFVPIEGGEERAVGRAATRGG